MGKFQDDLKPIPEHPSLEEVYEQTPFSEAFWTYLNYVILNIFGWFRDFLRGARIENRKGSAENNPPVKSNVFLCSTIRTRRFFLGFRSVVSKL